ncbi:PTS sugar transporter subunit IIB [Pediococcus parvulus]|uniref:PTS sugar transporter subunit IIB n=1 Tax=Pediococcus parvulus TaxID=54062 RepID=UPI00070B36FE|nr:PTS sugar transporter subunit IIB [Pediococcus parvulus]MCT3026753.1 PTS mannose/fructose/sorbose transporter subunit IIB [Pediococcus parvulus]GEL89844.1 N-acetylgalactosamine-specific phosphotransferase enzyme IIB component 1 [Pediococcus parvulus]GHC09087.1 N-acetylgalactosamine-specific phosphotransferase enzyme IIB component 1 [Pediococcus parvulus]
MSEQQKKIVFRVDNRLVHGQIAVNWKQAYQFSAIIVPDNQLAQDKLNQTLMKMAIRAANLKGYFVSVDEAPDIIKKLTVVHQSLLTEHRTKDSIFVVCRTPSVVRKIVEGGVKADSVTLWNMFKQPGKKKVSGVVYMDESDIEDVRAIENTGVSVTIQETPYSKKITVPKKI